MEKITVLVVEDEALIRMATAYMLQDAGYGVVEAANADAAIGILENRTDIRVVFTDIKMPGMLCGLKLARAVFDRWPYSSDRGVGAKHPIRNGISRNGAVYPKALCAGPYIADVGRVAWA